MKAALVSDTDWLDAVAAARARGAELICLPQLSFAPYVAATRDRAGLELAERPPSKSMRAALDVADGAWVAASAYESEGEGVFYVTSYLGVAGGQVSSYRQRRVDAEEGRFEQMFWAPGHSPNSAVETPVGTTATLVGADVGEADSWAELAAQNVRLVIAGVSEPAARWERTRVVVAGMAALHGATTLVVNRREAAAGVEFPGGSIAVDPAGAMIEAGADGLIEIEKR